ncbi:MAG: response regulator, partial [Pseudomonadota bacterium]
MINERVLLVDDEPRVGSSYARALRNVVKLEQASSAEEALSVLADSGAVAVVVSDMRMARMDGVDLLQRLIEHHPDTTRIMLTGNIDQRTAVRAVNEGGVFRYLTKPCDARVFGQAVLAGIQRYQIRRAEREMLDCPTDGAGEVARELLRLINPPAVKRIDPLTNLLKGMLDQAGAPRTPHDDEIAPLALLGAGAPGGAASAGDAKDSVDFADLSHRLASTVPTLVPVAKALRYQRKNFDGTGHPRDEIKGSALPMLSRVLRVALTFDQQVVQTQSQDDAFEA